MYSVLSVVKAFVKAFLNQLLPDRHQVVRQRRRHAEIGIALARAVEIRGDGRLQAEVPRQAGAFLHLLARVRAAGHLDALAVRSLNSPRKTCNSSRPTR